MTVKKLKEDSVNAKMSPLCAFVSGAAFFATFARPEIWPIFVVVGGLLASFSYLAYRWRFVE